MSTSTTIMPYLVNQFFDDNGVPLAGGTLYVWQANSTTAPPAGCGAYLDPTGTNAYANPLVLDSAGRSCNFSGSPTPIWLTYTAACSAYHLQLQDSLGNIIWDVPNFPLSSAAVTSAGFSVYSTVVAFKAAAPYLPATLGQLVYCEGYAAAGDGGGGFYSYSAYNSALIAIDSTGGMIVGDGTTNGSWLRIVDDFLNVRWFGAKGDEATDDSTALSIAQNIAYYWYSLTGKLGNMRLYFPTGNFMFNNNISLNEVQSEFAAGAKLIAGISVTIPCVVIPIINDVGPHFDGSRNPNYIKFVDGTGKNSPKVVYPEWWGAKGDGSTDDSSAIIAATNCYVATAATDNPTAIEVVFSSRLGYYIGTAIQAKSYMTLRGVQSDPSILNGTTYANYHGPKIISGTTSAVVDTTITGIQDFTVKDLAFDCYAGTPINITQATSDITLKNVYELSTTNGFVVTNGTNARIDHCLTGIIAVRGVSGTLAKNVYVGNCLASQISCNYVDTGLIENNTLSSIGNSIVTANSGFLRFYRNTIQGNILHSGPGIADGNDLVNGGTIMTTATPSLMAPFLAKNNVPLVSNIMTPPVGGNTPAGSSCSLPFTFSIAMGGFVTATILVANIPAQFSYANSILTGTFYANNSGGDSPSFDGCWIPINFSNFYPGHDGPIAQAWWDPTGNIQLQASASFADNASGTVVLTLIGV